MKVRFWRKPIPITPENCGHHGRVLTVLPTLDHVPLKDGHHTSFMLMRCKTCGGMVPFPQSNYDLAIREGTPAIKDQLRVLAERILALPN